MEKDKIIAPKFSQLKGIILFLCLDYLCILAGEGMMNLLRKLILGSYSSATSLELYIVFPIVYLFFMALGRLYVQRIPFYQEVEKIFYACLYATMAIVMLLFMTHSSRSVSRFFLLLLGPLNFINLSVMRYITKKWLDAMGYNKAPLLIIGAGKTAQQLVRGLKQDAGMSYEIIGLLEDYAVVGKELQEYPVLGGFKDAKRVVLETGVERVCICAPGLEGERLGRLIYELQPLVKRLAVIPNLSGVPVGNVTIDNLFNEHLLMIRVQNNLANVWNRFGKGCLDYILTLSGCILLLPILGIIMLKIKADSPGPAVYDGYRLGRNGKPFRCFKFRSMYVNGDEILEQYLQEHPEKREEWETYHKLEEDPRVTPFGNFMRRTSIDELPQIFNVLRGEMSLVGPRPYLVSEEKDMGHYAEAILLAKPGITGLWQVSGRSDIAFKDRLELEAWYVGNWNVWLDLVLLFKTIKVVLWRKGAK